MHRSPAESDAERRATDGPRHTAAIYRPISWRALRQGSRSWECALVLAAWLCSIAVGIGLGLASVIYEWSGLPLRFGGTDVYVTIYPPLAFATLWTLIFGFRWGFVPAYLSTLVLALYSGMPLLWSLAFAFANPVGLAVFAIAYRAIPIPYDLRSLDAIIFYVLLSFVSGVFGSTGSFIWTMTSNLGGYETLPIWQGWWLGAFLQTLFIVGPVLFFAGPRLSGWLMARGAAADKSYSQIQTLAGGALILAGVLLFLYLSVSLNVQSFESITASGSVTALKGAATSLVESTRAMYWVMTIIVLFASYFGFQLFTHWTASARSAAAALAAVNASLTERSGKLASALESERLAHEQLKTAQAQLIQAEKMSALAHLVAGVAHEINTPLGIALTAASHLEDETARFNRQTADGRVRKADFEHYVAIARETSSLLQTHVSRAAGLVQSFKQVAADQVVDDRRRFDLKTCLDELAQSLGPALRKGGHQLSIDCPASLELDSYPGALIQVMTNLAMNAIQHAFDAGREGRLSISAAPSAAGVVELACSDDGRGIPPENRPRIFDPFFTTRRGSGNTGLGLHVVFNLVTSKLGGRIELDGATERGARFVIQLPISAPVAA